MSLGFTCFFTKNRLLPKIPIVATTKNQRQLCGIAQHVLTEWPIKIVTIVDYGIVSFA